MEVSRHQWISWMKTWAKCQSSCSSFNRYTRLRCIANVYLEHISSDIQILYRAERLWSKVKQRMQICGLHRRSHRVELDHMQNKNWWLDHWIFWHANGFKILQVTCSKEVDSDEDSTIKFIIRAVPELGIGPNFGKKCRHLNWPDLLTRKSVHH